MEDYKFNYKITGASFKVRWGEDVLDFAVYLNRSFKNMNIPCEVTVETVTSRGFDVHVRKIDEI